MITKRSADFYRALHEKARTCTPEDFVYLLSKIDSTEELHRALRERADRCDPEELKSLLLQYGGDAGCLQSLQKGVDSRVSNEPRTAASPPPASYTSTMRKKEMMIDFQVGMGEFKDSFNVVAGHTNDNTHAQIALLLQRIQELERRLAGTPTKLKVQFKQNPEG